VPATDLCLGSFLNFAWQALEASASLPFLWRIDVNWFTLSDILLDPRRTVARDYAMPGPPVTLFSGGDGLLRAVHVEEISRKAMTAAITSRSRAALRRGACHCLSGVTWAVCNRTVPGRRIGPGHWPRHAP
jgi:hypothetical protein